ncbi:MAG: glycosyltransferase [Ferruginibacter sp.]
MKKKILHVINSLGAGGAETLLVNSLSEGGLPEYTSNMVVYFQGTSSIAERIDKNIKVICLNYKGIFSLPSVLIKLRKIIKENKIDIVHTHLNPAGFYTHLICPASVAQVHTLHTTYSMDKETEKSKLYLERKLYFTKKDCNIILLSDFTKADFLRSLSFRGQAFVLNNFVPDIFFKNSTKEYKVDNGILRVVSTGRLNAGKNFEYLLDIFSHLHDKEIYLDIYGSGDKTKYEKIVKERGIKVSMIGQHDNLWDVLYKYDLFIMPSKFEGFPLSLFEAMASEVPLMLSNIAPLKSIVKDNAIYFELDNDKAVADTLISILDKKIDINSLAKKAKVYAEKIVRREKYIQKLLSIYEKL